MIITILIQRLKKPSRAFLIKLGEISEYLCQSGLHLYSFCNLRALYNLPKQDIFNVGVCGA